MKPYRYGVTINDIIRSGWCRDLPILQTYVECHDMGFDIEIESIDQAWCDWDKEFGTNQAILKRAAKLKW